MRIRCLVALCLAVWASTAYSAPPDREQTAYEQAQLIHVQAAENLRRADLEKRSKESVSPYGPESLKRIFTDAIAQLDRGSEARAEKYWALLGLSDPIESPLSDLQLEQLGVLAVKFKGTTRGRLAQEILDHASAIEKERQTQEQYALARAKLESLHLNSTTDQLSEEQREVLIEIERQYSTSPSAAVARRLLSADVNRRIREELAKAGLVTL